MFSYYRMCSLTIECVLASLCVRERVCACECVYVCERERETNRRKETYYRICPCIIECGFLLQKVFSYDRMCSRMCLQKVFWYYRMCSLTIECVLLLCRIECVLECVYRMCSGTIECVLLLQNVFSYYAVWASHVDTKQPPAPPDLGVREIATFRRKSKKTAIQFSFSGNCVPVGQFFFKKNCQPLNSFSVVLFVVGNCWQFFFFNR